MGWHRSVSLLTLVVFLAFGFQVVGVFSEPITRNQPSIATVGSYRYGVLGWCPTDTSQSCSSYGVGYTLQDDTDTKWNNSTQKTLSSIAIVHIVAAGLLLITLLMSCGTVWRNQKYWTAVEIMLSLCFTAAALSFAVEVALFRTSLNFAGWFTLASTVLCIVAIVALALMQKSLQASLGRTNINGKDTLLTDDSVLFERGGDFIIGRDDEKMLQGPTKSGFSTTSLSSSGFQIPKPPQVRTPGSESKYERIPESAKGQGLNSLQQSGIMPNSRNGTQSNSRLPQLPVGSSESVGAIPRQQQGNWQRGPIPVSKTGVPPVSAQGGAFGAVAGAPTMATGAAAAAAATLGASAALSRTQNQPGQSRGAHTSTISIASTQAARVPAGAYLHSFEDSARHDASVVQNPRTGAGALKAESATLEYCKDETESKSPLAQSKVPNYSRMSAQEKANASPSSQNPRTNNIMLDRYMDSAHLATPQQRHDPYYEAAVARAGAQTPESESSHYTSISEQQQQKQDPNRAGPPPEASIQHNPDNYASSYQNAPAQQNESYAQYYRSTQPYQGSEAPYSYYPQTQPSYQYYQNSQPQYYGQGANNNYNQPMVYGNQNERYQGAYPSAAGYAAYKPAGRGHSRPQINQRSELALQSNPDFSLGNLGRKKRPGMR